MIRIGYVLTVATLIASTAMIAHAETPTHGYFTTTDGIKIHYMQLGGKGSYVMLIHGYLGSAKGNWFDNGIAGALARNHRVVALDCRNHGLSDKPQLRGRGIPQDVIELMDHLKIKKAHFHGYSMGGSITGSILASHPERFITAAFGGSGLREHDPSWLAKVPADKEGTDPQEAMVLRLLIIRSAMNSGVSREDAEKAADTALSARSSRPPATSPRPGPKMDLAEITIPVLAINGEYDRPYSKTHRMWRELSDFTNVILPGKSHLTAIVAPYMPKEYLSSLVRFINANDEYPSNPMGR